MKSGFSNLDGEFNKRHHFVSFWNPTKYKLKVVCSIIHSFIHFEDISYKDSETGQQQEQPRFGGSKAVSVGTDLAGLRKTDTRAVMEKWRALSPCRVHRRCGSRRAQRPLEPGWRAGGVRSRRVRTALQVKSEPWVLLCPRPGLLLDSHPPAGAEPLGVTQSDTEQGAPDTAQYDALLSDVCYTGSKQRQEDWLTPLFLGGTCGRGDQGEHVKVL